MKALDGAQRSSNPFVLLGALDVALYRREDPRFEELAVRSLIRLADSQLGRSDGADRYQLLSALSGLVQSRMVLLPGCATHPNYWRLACALMHGGWLLDELEATGVRSDIESFLKWLRENRPTASYYADAAGARTEPMLYVGQLTAASLREEVARRLDLLRARHEKAGRPTSWSDETRAAWKQVQATVRNQLFGSPGPLEGDRRPLRYIPEGILDAAKRAWTDRGEVSLLQILAFFSQGAQPNGEDLEAARDCVRQIGQSPAADGRLPEMAELNFASVVAVACRDLPLGDEVAEALVRLSSGTSEPGGVYPIVHLMVQTAAVNAEKESWSKWLEGRLESVAKALPGPPSTSAGCVSGQLAGNAGCAALRGVVPPASAGGGALRRCVGAQSVAGRVERWLHTHSCEECSHEDGGRVILRGVGRSVMPAWDGSAGWIVGGVRGGRNMMSTG